jgi:hypothetical protein
MAIHSGRATGNLAVRVDDLAIGSEIAGGNAVSAASIQTSTKWGTRGASSFFYHSRSALAREFCKRWTGGFNPNLEPSFVGHQGVPGLSKSRRGPVGEC